MTDEEETFFDYNYQLIQFFVRLSEQGDGERKKGEHLFACGFGDHSESEYDETEDEETEDDEEDEDGV